MLHRKIITFFNLKLVFLFLFCFIFMNETVSFALTNDQILAAKNNGIISAMCYVYDLMTGNIARAIMAVFVMGTGWLFFLGAVKDWKTIFFFSLAVTIMFGGIELANIISHNKFSCAFIYNTEEINKNTIYNAGDCQIVDIDEYASGQIWYKCVKKGNDVDCTNKSKENIILDETLIEYGDRVMLASCQAGSFKKDNNKILKYLCDKNGKKFTILNGTEKEDAKCVKACTKKSLNSILRSYHAKASMDNKNNYIILEKSGRYEQDNYFTAGTKIDLDCNSGYFEYDSDNKISKIGLFAECDKDKSEFKIVGSCKKKCNISNTIYKYSVSEWEKYDSNSDKWVEIDNNEQVYYGEKIRIKTCNFKSNYSFQDVGMNDDVEKMTLTCGEDGAWKQDNKGLTCSKKCILDTYNYYSNNVWKTDCPISGNCITDLNGKNEFFEGDIVGVTDCINSNFNIDLDNNPKKLRLTCNADGKWSSNNGSRCLEKCSLENIEGYAVTKSWLVCDKNNDNCKNSNNITSVISGTKVSPVACIDNYYINEKKISTFTCNENGKFVRDSGFYDEVCRMGCQFKDLLNLDQNSLAWTKTNSSGKVVETDLETINFNVSTEGITTYNTYFRIKACNNDYKVLEDSLLVRCSDNGEWTVVKYANNICYDKCDIRYFSLENNITEWKIYNESSDTYKDFSDNSIDNGAKITPIECSDRFTLDPSINTNFNISCKNGSLYKSKENMKICHLKCNFNLENSKVKKWSVKNGLVDHDIEIRITECSDGFSMQSRDPVFKCVDGDIKILKTAIENVCVQ